MKYKFFAYIFLVIFVLVSVQFLGYMHEQVHVEIYRSYGIESHIEYFSHFPDLVTIAEEPCPQDSTCNLANNINDVVGYHLMPIFSTFLIFITIIIMEIMDLQYLQ